MSLLKMEAFVQAKGPSALITNEIRGSVRIGVLSRSRSTYTCKQDQPLDRVKSGRTVSQCEPLRSPEPGLMTDLGSKVLTFWTICPSLSPPISIFPPPGKGGFSPRFPSIWMFMIRVKEHVEQSPRMAVVWFLSGDLGPETTRVARVVSVG